MKHAALIIGKTVVKKTIIKMQKENRPRQVDITDPQRGKNNKQKKQDNTEKSTKTMVSKSRWGDARE